MKFRRSLSILAVFGAATFTATEVSATCPGPSCPSGRSSISDGLGAALVGGVILNKRPADARWTQRMMRPSFAQRSAKELQTALNYFGFDAGAPDGLLGPRSRAAISSYQAHVGLPETGTLTAKEQYDLLWAFRISQDEAVADASDEVQIAQRRENLGRAMAMIQDSQNRQTAAVLAARPAQPAALPRLAAHPLSPLPGVARLCSDEALRVTTGEQRTDRPDTHVAIEAAQDMPARSSAVDAPQPTDLLERRLCSSREHMMASGASEMASISGMDEAQIAAQCSQIEPFLARVLPKDWDQLSSEAVIAQLKSAVISTGTRPETTVRTARVCAALGYKEDDSELVLFSALFGSASSDADMLETVALIRANADPNWIESTAIQSWFGAAFAASDPTVVGNTDREALKSQIEKASGR